MLTIVIAGVAALAAVGIVIDQLFRLRDWLNKSPPDDTAGGGRADPPES
jgi:hypothetical protein